MSHEGPKFNDNNIYRVRKDSRLNQGLFLAKLVLKKHGSVQIEGMGECISLAFKLAQILSKDGYTTIQKIHEENIEREGKREINPKIAITLEKSAAFDKLTEGLVLREKWLHQPTQHLPTNISLNSFLSYFFSFYDSKYG